MLSEDQRASIGQAMVDVIKDDLEKLVLSILDDSTVRQISGVVVEVHSNLGEVKEYKFQNIPEAIEFLNNVELKAVFIATDSLTMFEPPPTFEDEDEGCEPDSEA